MPKLHEVPLDIEPFDIKALAHTLKEHEDAIAGAWIFLHRDNTMSWERGAITKRDMLWMLERMKIELMESVND